MMGSIDWIPIADMPDTLKDGREVLLWETVSRGGSEVATWDPADRWAGPKRGVWCSTDGATIHGITHFAEITPPV